MYYVTKVGVDNFDTLIFQTDLVNAYLKAHEYKVSASIIQSHLETTIQLQETLRHAFIRAESSTESSQNVILNNRDSTNDNINALSQQGVNHWLINTLAFTCFNLFVLNHFGFLPTPVCEQVGTPLISAL